MIGIPDAVGISLGSWPRETMEDAAALAFELGFGKLEVECEGQGSIESVASRTADAHAEVVAVSIGTTFDRTRADRFLFGPDLSPTERPTFRSVARAIDSARETRARVLVIGGLEVATSDRETMHKALASAIADGTDPMDRRKRIESVLAVREKDRDRALEDLCRWIHEITTRVDGLTIALSPSPHPMSLLGAIEATWVLESLTKRGVRYWHDVAAAHLRTLWGLEPEGAWSNTIDRFAIGTYVSDVVGFEAGHPPGFGTLRLAEMLRSIPASRPRVLKLRNPLHRLALVGALETLG